jgi:hypothetical protein
MLGSLSEVCEGLLEEAINMYERDGAVMTTTFALGHSRSAFAQPATEEGCTINDETRVRIHALLASTVGAVFIGRIDETYLAERPADEEQLLKHDLERMALTDPSIKTAIVVQAMHTKSEESLIAVASELIDDDGNTEWEFNLYDSIEGQIIDDCYKTISLAALITNPLTDSELRYELKEMGWAIADSDDLARDMREE